MSPFLIQYFAIFLICLFALYFFSALKIRELAVISARSHCRKLELQLLDQSVSLNKIRFFISSNKTIVIARFYDFEFTSTGDERYKGVIEMYGRQLEKITLQAYRIPAVQNPNKIAPE